MKMEEIRMNRQFQTYIDKLKPLLKAGKTVLTQYVTCIYFF